VRGREMERERGRERERERRIERERERDGEGPWNRERTCFIIFLACSLVISFATEFMHHIRRNYIFLACRC